MSKLLQFNDLKHGNKYRYGLAEIFQIRGTKAGIQDNSYSFPFLLRKLPPFLIIPHPVPSTSVA
jgi:hypothetical protein